MPSLRELQRAFAATVLAPEGTPASFALAGAGDAAERIAIYRRAIAANYRNALAATYPVVRQLVGAPFFNTAVDHFARQRPSVSGDLNLYGAQFADFLAAYPYAAGLPYLPDVARLEWAMDEANRARECPLPPGAVLNALAAVAPERLPSVRLVVAPSCRIVASAYPILRIWQAHQGGHDDAGSVDLAAGGDALLVRRDGDEVTLTRLATGEGAWLAACAAGKVLGAAIDAAQALDAGFDLGAALRTHVAAGTLGSVVAG